jgi:hypothetical protein
MRVARWSWVLLFGVALAACGERGARVERVTASGLGATDFVLLEARGTRDGDRTRAAWIFEASDGRRLELQLTLGYDPQLFLASGSWVGEGTGGSVRAESLLFTGGQGQGVSAGGTYTLLVGAEERWRVVLPLTRLQQEGWKP